MAFVAESDALIIDLRENGGGNPAMVAFLGAYLLPGTETHMADIVWRAEGRTESLTTLASVPGRRYSGLLYVLTSARTFSGGEGLAYFLKNRKRAIVIGERTAGAANAGRGQAIGPRFEMVVPSGRVVDPITGTNWEGVGVEPDVSVPEAIALETAHLDALAKLERAEKDSEWRSRLEQAAREARSALAAASRRLRPAAKPSLVGNTEFRLRGAGYARTVAVVGSFNGWNETATPCARVGNEWVCRMNLARGRHTYKFAVDGMLFVDPANPAVELNQTGAAVSIRVR
jgi:retinol-binding protein 3